MLLFLFLSEKKLDLFSKSLSFLFFIILSHINSYASFQQASLREFLGGQEDYLTQNLIKQLSSVKKLKPSYGVILLNNTESFQDKIHLIRRAENHLRLAYYIFSPDESSSYLANELLKKAREGVKIQLMLDFFTAYPNIDFFSYLRNQSNGNLEIRFFNPPTHNLFSDARYMTWPCPKKILELGIASSCTEYKDREISKYLTLTKKNNSPQRNLLAQLFLSGVYGKNPELLKIATSLQAHELSTVFDKEKIQKDSNEDLEDLLELGELLYRAKILKEIEAIVKLSLAFLTHGETIAPIYNTITSIVPLDSIHRGENSARDWSFASDFLHHKILLSDEYCFQVGGRNIENSYHVEPGSPLTSKYIFQDVDVSFCLKKGGRELAESYDRLFSFEPMTRSIEEIESLLPSQWINNIELLSETVSKCMPEVIDGSASEMIHFEDCIYFEFEKKKDFRPFSKIHLNFKKDITHFKKTFHTSEATAQFEPNIKLSAEDIKNINLSYIENLPFSIKESNPNRRFYGASHFADLRSGKGIHELFYRMLKDSCFRSEESGNKERVLIHQAYFMPPATTLEALGNMVNGQWPCQNVQLDIVTNSLKTTDLSIINFFGRYQIKAWLQKAFLHQYMRPIDSLKNPKFMLKTRRSRHTRSAKVRIFEFQVENIPRSLHTKVMMTGKVMYIGSANMDPRSYMMDTNNGVVFTQAKEAKRKYLESIDLLINENQLIEKTETYLFNNRGEALRLRDLQSIDRILIKKELANFPNVAEKISQKHFDKSFKWIDKLTTLMYNQSQEIVAHPLNALEPCYLKKCPITGRERRRKTANSFNNLWKLF